MDHTVSLGQLNFSGPHRWDCPFFVDHLGGPIHSQWTTLMGLFILRWYPFWNFTFLVGLPCMHSTLDRTHLLPWLDCSAFPTLLECSMHAHSSCFLTVYWKGFSRIATSSGLQYISQIATFSGLPYISQIAISSGLLYTSKIATFSGLLYISHTATFSGLVFISQITTSSSGLRLVFMYYTQASCPLCWTTECCLGRTASPFP